MRSVTRHRVTLGQSFLNVQYNPAPHQEGKPKDLANSNAAEESHIPLSENMNCAVDQTHDVVGPH
jgi:hypothetical protein